MNEIMTKLIIGLTVFFVILLIIINEKQVRTPPIDKVAEEKAWIASVQLSNEKIAELSTPCLKAGLDVEIETSYARIENRKVPVRVVCSQANKSTGVRAVSEEDIDANSISVMEHVGLKLIGF